MPLPYYVSPEQMMKDKAEYARKGIARGRSIVTLEYREGILLVAENPSSLLHKVSEIYDRIAFAGVGKYNEFENLRIAGIRHADIKGYSYSRGDVTAKALANAYSQALGNIFTQDIKPFEVEVLVAEVGVDNGAKSEIYHILYDGTIEDEKNYAAMGGQADEILINAIRMRDQFEHLRKRIHDRSERLKRQKLNMAWENPDLQDLRGVAEEIWQLAYNDELSLAELHCRSGFCDWKIYRAVDEMVRTGLFSLSAGHDQLQLMEER